MNKEELIGKLHMIYAGDRNALDEMIGYYDGLKEVVELLKKENQELKSQLRGTTHCFDEEEHRKLKDEIKKLERIIELCHLDAKETLATINYEQELQQKEFINKIKELETKLKENGINE